MPTASAFDLKSAAHKLRLALSFDESRSETFVRELLEGAGIAVGGNNPDITVHNKAFYTRILRDGSLGLGESYMNGEWDAESLDQVLCRILLGKLDVVARSNIRLMLYVARGKLFNLQSSARAFEIGERHYDIGNELYERMLDSETMAYTCGYWRGGATSLKEAQVAKLELICKKIGLEPGMKVLELGCGWGGFAKHAATHHGVSVLGVTVSKEQTAFGTKFTAGLPVEIRTQDYRDVRGTFDRVVSIGLLEHVGPKNYATYMEHVDSCLAPDGVGFVHTITGNRAVDSIEPWFGKYIFPNAVLPTLKTIGTAMDDRFVCEDVHNIGPDYDTTLLAWNDNFQRSWPELVAINPAKYTERFRRMWTYYLLCSAAGFRARYNQLLQTVFTRPGTPQPDCRQQ